MLLILVSKKTSFASSIRSLSGTDAWLFMNAYVYVKRRREPLEAEACNHRPCEFKHVNAVACRRFVDVASREKPMKMEEERVA